jgi:intracellular sulfur oxidation DsrE/DsrF family protein
MPYPNSPLQIDLPVTLRDVKAVFSIASLSFEGDLPAAIFHLRLITNDVSDWEASSDIVAVFHTNAGHATLADEAYNADRGITTGNPYRGLLQDLMTRGVRVELCGATAKVHHYGNEDLIPGILVNTDAMSRTIELVQDDFVKISES